MTTGVGDKSVINYLGNIEFPEELKINIFQHIGIGRFPAIACTCQELHQFFQNHQAQIWSPLVNEKFPITHAELVRHYPIGTVNWQRLLSSLTFSPKEGGGIESPVSQAIAQKTYTVNTLVKGSSDNVTLCMKFSRGSIFLGQLDGSIKIVNASGVVSFPVFESEGLRELDIIDENLLIAYSNGRTDKKIVNFVKQVVIATLGAHSTCCAKEGFLYKMDFDEDKGEGRFSIIKLGEMDNIQKYTFAIPKVSCSLMQTSFNYPPKVMGNSMALYYWDFGAAFTSELKFFDIESKTLSKQSFNAGYTSNWDAVNQQLCTINSNNYLTLIDLERNEVIFSSIRTSYPFTNGFGALSSTVDDQSFYYGMKFRSEITVVSRLIKSNDVKNYLIGEIKTGLDRVLEIQKVGNRIYALGGNYDVVCIDLLPHDSFFLETNPDAT